MDAEADAITGRWRNEPGNAEQLLTRRFEAVEERSQVIEANAGLVRVRRAATVTAAMTSIAAAFGSDALLAG